MIKVYSKDGCPFCVRAKNLLVAHGLEFEEVRIDLDHDARKFLLMQGHKSVPQLYVDETLLVEGGFNGLAGLSVADIEERISEINGN